MEHPTGPSHDIPPHSGGRYYKEIDNPICLSEIAAKHDAMEYKSYADFHSDVLTMVNNAMQFNDTCTAEYILSLVMHTELCEARNALAISAPSLVEAI